MPDADAAVTTRLAQGPGGRPAVVKRARGPAAARLRVEADRLAAAHHPGVVELLAVHDADGVVELVLAYAGPRSLADLLHDDVGADALAPVIAAVAATLADVHARGLAHGRVSADHVVVGSAARPVLCGWGDGTAADGGPSAPEDDVAAVGALLQLVADSSDDPAARRLAALGARATAPDATARPTMARLAAELAGAQPEPTADDEEAPRAGVVVPRAAGRRWLPAGRSRSVTAVGATVVVVLVGVAAVVVRGGGGPPAGTAAASMDPAVVPTTTSAPSTTTTTAALPQQVWPPAASSCPDAPVPAADVDGDGCPDALTVADRVVHAAGERWEVGEPGDVVVLGDWDCDGAATPGVLRPASGEVFLFPSWADATVPAARTAPGAVTAHAVDDPVGCQRLEAVDASGRTVVADG